jgi:hypothetical protein
MRSAIARLAEQAGTTTDERRLARHTRRCASCRRRAHQLGVHPRTATRSVAARAAALLPLPGFLRRRAEVSQPASGSPHGPPPFVDVFGPGTSQLGAALTERAAALVAAAALAGAGGAMLAGGPATIHRSAPLDSPPPKEHRLAPTGSHRPQPGSASFERPKSTREAPKREAAPRFRSAPPRSAPTGPTTGSRGPAPAKPLARTAPPPGLDAIPEQLNLDNGGQDPPPIGVDINPAQGLSNAVPSGSLQPQSPPGDSGTPLARTAEAVPPAAAPASESNFTS